jgi:hypothetical protein
MLPSPRSPQHDANLLLGRKCRRAARRMSLIASSAGCFSDAGFCLIFAPCGYNDPEILPRKTALCLKGAEADRCNDVAIDLTNGDRNAPRISDEERLNGFQNLVLGHWLIERAVRPRLANKQADGARMPRLDRMNLQRC